MAQAVQAAILLLEEDKQPQLAADVLRLARDRWDRAVDGDMSAAERRAAALAQARALEQAPP